MNLPPPVPPTVPTPEPLPMYFGAEPGRLFGWLHHPAPGESSGVGLVICNPFGFEAVCAHRSLRQFALSAADAGIASLRFDYPGTGNSPGDEFEPDVLRGWVRSVRSAIDCLKQSCRVEQVVLLGVRLGATVAALSGFECGDVAGMVAVAPVLSGRVYIREMTMLGQTGTPSAVGVAAPDVADASGWPAPAGSLESAGFLMTPETVEALSAVDLRKQLGRPAPRVLIVDRDDVPSAAPWLPALRAQGVDVRLEHWPGYSGMVADPQLTRVPTHMLDGVIAWLRAGAPLSAATALAATASAAIPQSVACPTGPRLLTVVPTPHGPATLCETVVSIDTGASKLFGIFTECQGAAPTTAVLMLNSGAVHHIGPNRLWVRLARRWAARGVAVLRIDISGIGDSPARPGAQPNVVYSPHAVSDTEAALAFLRARCPGASCHVMGLCSGAYHSLKAAVAGQPVVSAVMINPLTYHWKEGTELGSLKDYEVIELAAKYRRKLFTGQTWRKLLRGQLDLRMIGEALLRRPGAAIAPHALELARWLRLPLRNDLATALNSTAGRGVGLRFVFGQGATGYRLLLQQGGRAVQRLLGRRQASVDFVAGADHTFTRAAARERLVARLDEIVLPPR